MWAKVEASSEGDQIGSRVSWMLAFLPSGGHGSLLGQGMWEVWRGVFIRVWTGTGQFEEQNPSPGMHSTFTTQGHKLEGRRAASEGLMERFLGGLPWSLGEESEAQLGKLGHSQSFS